MIKIVIQIGEKEISLTPEEARSIYEDLKKHFEAALAPPIDPFKKYRDWTDWTRPWSPPVYGPITYVDQIPTLKPGDPTCFKGGNNS